MSENIEAPVKPDEPVKTEVAAELPLPEAEWTIMIFMAGDNNLTDPSILALAELRKSNKENNVHVSVQLDPNDERMKTQRLIINKRRKGKKAAGGKPSGAQGLTPGQDEEGGLSDDAIKVPDGEGLPEGQVKFLQPRTAVATTTPRMKNGETDTADPKTLFDFISWSKDNCPAKHYVLVLAAHSAGTEDGFLMKDENPPGSMSFQNLVNVLEQVKSRLGIKLEILGLDACLMNMAEICYELRGFVELVVGAQGYVPNPGWPYNQIVASLEDAQGQMSADKLARTIVDKYVQFYLENAALGGLSVDLGALKVDASDKVREAVANLVEVVLPKLQADDKEFQRALVYAHWATQSYNGELFVDLHDFCKMLIENYVDSESKPRDEAVSKMCKLVQDAVAEMRIISCFCGIDYQHSRGLSVYFPWSVIFDSYRDLKFAKESHWIEFLEMYVEQTRRAPRGGPANGDAASVERSFLLFDAPFELKENSRRDPPYGHGPAGHMRSMRNPPRAWTSKGITECTKDEGRLRRIFESIR